MPLATDLMGVGVPAHVAGRLGTVSPLTMSAAGTTYATSTKILAEQYLVSITNDALTSLSVGLPRVTILANPYVINNSGSANSATLRASTSVLISANGASDSLIAVAANKTVIVWPISSTLWIGLTA